MNQEITISLNTFDYLDENLPAYEINNAQQIIGYLKENYFVVDSKLEYAKMLWEKINDLKEERNKKYFKELLGKLINKNKVVNCTNIDGLIIAEQSNDKIFLNPILVNKDIKKMQIKYPIEIHNSQSFISPETYHKLKHSKAVLVFEREVIYDIVEILTPYLYETRSIFIEDPYLPNERAFNILKNIVTISECKDYKLKVLSEYNYNRKKEGKQYENFKIFLEELEDKDISIEIIEYTDKIHHDRYVYTDQISLKIPGGFDFIKEGKIVDKQNKKVEIIVTPR